MQQQLISLSPDLARLEAEGFDISVDGAYLITRRLPYVDAQKKVQYGTLICVLTLATPTRTGQPQDHTSYFCGETPCDSLGVGLTGLVNNSNKQQLTNMLVADHYFSSKPASGNYPDFYEKVSTYAKIIGVQAQAIDPAVTWKPLKQ
ncbi:DUF6791 domain-containing protein [Mucilaginibacter glaciei]|uniref:DUF6791 domain-containing protein n=1 Tax=Mucilaginibacter glaciei TaxID=2772109 RepID=A0A926P0M6_9SPHI|nr:DUF6791 domain-containing protein [Mucilaginibacter glaciei]MBD1395134.1 hypothetical protein [Mucilaginibacter glaciei]